MWDSTVVKICLNRGLLDYNADEEVGEPLNEEQVTRVGLSSKGK